MRPSPCTVAFRSWPRLVTTPSQPSWLAANGEVSLPWKSYGLWMIKQSHHKGKLRLHWLYCVVYKRNLFLWSLALDTNYTRAVHSSISWTLGGLGSPGWADSGARSGKSYNGSKVLCPNPALNGEIRKLIPTHSTEFRSHRLLDWLLTRQKEL